MGLELLLAPIALGAAGVVLAVPGNISSMVVETLLAQVELARRLLQYFGYAGTRVQLLLDNVDDSEPISDDQPNRAAKFEEWVYPEDTDPHTRLLTLFDNLSLQSEQLQEMNEVELPNWSTFGTLELDNEACTMCLACTTLCPVGALQSVGDGIELDFLRRPVYNVVCVKRAVPKMRSSVVHVLTIRLCVLLN